jgi:hypothetical protein
LAKFRPLSETKKELNQEIERVKNLPSVWFYNETLQDNFWAEIEKKVDFSLEKAFNEVDQKVQNLSDMNRSARKINSMMARFNQIDHETLISPRYLIRCRRER